VRLTLAATTGFLLSALAVAMGITRSADRAILDALQPLASPPVDFVSSLLSAVGGVVVTSGAALLLTAVLLRRRDPWALVPLLLFVGVGIEIVLKRVIDHPAPPAELLRDAHWLAVGGSDGGGNAFPSGHVSRTTFLALLVAGRWPWARWAAAILVAAMAFTRVYSASHWLSDVVGGLCLGAALAGLAAWVATRSRT